MSREYTTNGETNPGLWEPATAWTCTEYVGDTPIADWEIDLDGQTNEPLWTKLRTYLPGSSAGDAAGAQLNADDSIQYCHGDLVGSTVATTDADGTNGVFDGPAITVAYTAFGELLANDGNDNISIGAAAPIGFPRYQYCGAWGHESGSADGSGALLSLTGHDSSLPPITLMHVGARWYDPALGRFVQRDPAGLEGALNVYLYCVNDPLSVIDPSGLWSWREFWKGLIGGTIGGAIGGAVVGSQVPLVGTIVGAIAGGIVGGDSWWCRRWCIGEWTSRDRQWHSSGHADARGYRPVNAPAWSESGHSKAATEPGVWTQRSHLLSDKIQRRRHC